MYIKNPFRKENQQSFISDLFFGDLKQMTINFNWLAGKKTYLMAALLFAYALGGYFTGHLTLEAAVGLLWGSGALSAIRAAIAKAQ